MTTGGLSHDLETERGLMGILLTTPEQPHIRAEVAEIIQDTDLSAQHRVIYRAILAQDGEPADPLSVTAFLEKKGPQYLKRAGGDDYIHRLAYDPQPFVMASQYAQQIAALGVQLRREQAAQRAVKAIMKGEIADARKVLDDLDQGDRDRAGAALDLMTADQLLDADWPEPTWAIPGMLPVGLSILAGKSKVGKSWLALQILQAVAAGGVALGQRVEAGPVLYLALEDPYRRLADRMKRQNWPRGLSADFMVLADFQREIGDLRNGGGAKLARQIEHKRYRLVVIDTLSRSVYGDQNDVGEMTAALSPLQNMAHVQDCAVLLIDHHHKLAGADALADILGSTSKGAVSDTAWGLYRDRGKASAALSIIGRDVEEQKLALTFDGLTCSWQCEGEAHTVTMTKNRLDVLDALEQMGWTTCQELADALDRNKGSVYRDLQDLAADRYVLKQGNRYALENEALP